MSSISRPPSRPARHSRGLTGAAADVTVNDMRTSSAPLAEAFGCGAAGPGVTTDDLDGMTVTGGRWWFNLRPSNTEPLLRLNVEASDEATLAAVRDEVLRIVRDAGV
jgi:phosphomannomutase